MSRPGSILKFERAHQHLSDAKAAVSQFFAADDAYEIASDEETEPGKQLFWITLLRDPPEEISLAAGDAIHNLRSALDHIVYELSSKREANPRDTSFPLFTKEEDWDKRDKRGALQISSGLYRVRLLPDGAKTLIYNLQPCPRPEPWKPDLFGPNRQRLRELHSLDIADKHKNLNVAVLYAGPSAIGTNEFSPTRFEHFHMGPLQRDTRTLLLRLSFPEGKVDVELIPMLDIVFSEGLTPNEPVGRKLDELLRNVGMVLNALSRF
jgi:hypothetical protein